MTSVGSPLYWAIFLVVVFGMLAIDLLVFNRKAHAVSIKEALVWSAVWISLALAFGGVVYVQLGHEQGLQYVTGWLIEKALSVDNIFVFIVLFSYFAVPQQLQHRVLFWGIIGALILRAIFIVAGAALIRKFSWIMYIFGGFLVFTGVKLMFKQDEEVNPESNPILRVFRRFVRMTSDFRGGAFFVKENGRRYATPLFLALVMVEFTDLLFALDSIPAVFAVSQDPFIIFTSNIFAILGLRALFFVVGGILSKFRFLQYGLAVVLAFIGAKMLVVKWYHVPIGLSLGVIAGLLGGSIVISLLVPPKEGPAAEHDPAAGGTTLPPGEVTATATAVAASDTKEPPEAK